jgi:diguanylate cyclase (GGDEF)-like protein
MFSIDERITNLLIESQSKTYQNSNLLARVKLLSNDANPAEQYILLLVKANLSTGLRKHHNIIEILDEINVIETNMNPEQLNAQPFIDVYKQRAESYASIGQFKRAYEAKQRFLDKYNAFLLDEKNKHILELETKYETKKKRDINKLLNNQTILKELEINETLSNEVTQRRNIYILGAIALLFIILLARLTVINRRIRNLSKQDMLTGLYNRKTLFRYGKSATNRCISSDQSLCLLAIHIDDFKTINHQYGDYIGDEILKRLATIGKESMRTRDVFARLDDATFIAVLPESTVGEVKAIAQHLKEKFSSVSFNYVGIPQTINLSLGIVELSETLNNFESLLNAGMDVLYHLKDDNGDTISIYNE